jgi:hypothetical protein
MARKCQLCGKSIGLLSNYGSDKDPICFDCSQAKLKANNNSSDEKKDCVSASSISESSNLANSDSLPPQSNPNENSKKNLEIMHPSFVYHDNKILGPYAIEVLKKMILDGLVFPTDQVWNSAMQTRISAQEYLTNLNSHIANNIQPSQSSSTDGFGISKEVSPPNQLPEEITLECAPYAGAFPEIFRLI